MALKDQALLEAVEAQREANADLPPLRSKGRGDLNPSAPNEARRVFSRPPGFLWPQIHAPRRRW